MSEKRMFAKSIVLSDDFLDMPATARCLYFTLNMLADDDGFVNSPKSIMRQCMATIDDMKILFAKCYLIPFDSGIVVIRHWRINNYLRCDRYKPTVYLEEKSHLVIEKDGSYSKIENQSGNAQIEPAVAVQEIADSDSAAEQPTEIDGQEAEEKSAEAKKEKKEKIAPLTEREPRNDIEKVEKEYLVNYNRLYTLGVLKSQKPVINWTVSRKLTKEVIKKYGVDVIVDAVRKSLGNNFCIFKGYSLTTILSSGVLAELINGSNAPPQQHIDLSDKYDMTQSKGAYYG